MKVKLLVVTVLTSLVVLGSISTEGASPSVSGPTGMVNMPEAEVVGGGNISLAGHILLADNTEVSLKANYGLTEDLEGGLRLDLGGDETSVTVYGKYKFLEKTATSPFSVAIGGGYSFAEISVLNLYGVGSYYLDGTPLVLSGSIYWERISREVAGEEVSDSDVALALGANYMVNPKLDVVGELWFAGADRLNGGIRYYMSDKVSLEAFLISAPILEDIHIVIGGSTYL